MWCVCVCVCMCVCVCVINEYNIITFLTVVLFQCCVQTGFSKYEKALYASLSGDIRNVSGTHSNAPSLDMTVCVCVCVCVCVDFASV